MRLGRRVPAALHDDFFRPRWPHHPDEACGGGDAKGDAQVDFGDPELRLAGGDPEVAGQGEAPSPTHRVAVDHGDGGLLEALEERLGAFEEPTELALALGESVAALFRRHGRLEARVGPRREDRGRAGHDDDPRGGIITQRGESDRQLGQHCVAERIAALGAVQGHGGYGTFAGEGDVGADRGVHRYRGTLAHGPRTGNAAPGEGPACVWGRRGYNPSIFRFSARRRPPVIATTPRVRRP